MTSSRFGFGRRALFQQGGLLAVLQTLGAGMQKAAAAPLEFGANLYRSIAVRPMVNARGTFTIISGSQTLPEVKRAMDDASRTHVDMDELMNGVAQRLAELTGAEWGIVTAGCCAALTHCTSAAIAGCNPERMQRLPNLEGLRNEVIVPPYSRNQYDHAVRMLGVKLVVPRDRAELESSFNARTAMVYILAGSGDDGPLGTRVISEVAKRHNVPVIVDAAAEILTVKPNVHLARGATAVAYSGGKCLRGPQSAGLLIGEKNLLQAAWLNSAPHHAFGRSLKTGKEEIMGMLAAVEMWVKRDHQAEWKQWESWLAQIAASVQRVPGVTATVTQPGAGLSNRTPRLNIQWDGAKLGITGQELQQTLLDNEPRIVVGGATGSRPASMNSSLSVIAYMLQAEEIPVVADRIHALLARPPQFQNPPEPPQGQPVSIAGQWDVEINFLRDSARHRFVFEQTGANLVGTHHGEFSSGDLSGAVAGNTIRFQSGYQGEGSRVSYRFTGAVESGKMTGTVALGEYGEARWTAQKRQYRTGGRGGSQ